MIGFKKRGEMPNDHPFRMDNSFFKSQMTASERSELDRLTDAVRRTLTARDVDRRIMFTATVRVLAAVIAHEFPIEEHQDRIRNVQDNIALYVNLFVTRERRIIS